MSFLVIDTEGKDILKEIAIIDPAGKVIYHGFNQATNPKHPECQPLEQVVKTTQEIIAKHDLVFHYAQHDQEVLSDAFKRVGQQWPSEQMLCTWELSQEIYPDYESYSLEYLSKVLDLKVNNKYFNSGMAHDAAYDAQYTHQLYLNLQEQIKNKLRNAEKPNPFASNRVDNPFQKLDDNLSVYQDEFKYLANLIKGIEQDSEHQSVGCVLIGESGSGKTHLMMRLAQQLLSSNRLFFIRCPNNAESIFFHIYSRTLESLIQKVDGQYTQLDYLIAKSVINILNVQLKQKRKIITGNEKKIRDELTEDPFNLFKKMGSEETQIFHRRWDVIDKNLIKWWTDNYGNEGNKVKILEGIIKFCRYRDPNKRDYVTRWLAGNELETEEVESIGLNNWSDSLSREEFSLEAMSVLGRLSLQDKPMIIIFDQLESLVFYPDILHRYGERVKELFTHVPNALFINNLFPDRWTHFQETYDPSVIDRISQHKIALKLPSDDQIKQILQQRLQSLQSDKLQLECLFSEDDLSDILDNPSIRAVINRSAEYYRYRIDDILLPPKVHIFKTEESVLQALTRLESEITNIKSILASNNLINRIATNQSTTIIENSSLPSNPQEVSSSSKLTANTHKVSIADYIREHEKLIRAEWQSAKIISDADDIGKLKAIGIALKSIYPITMGVARLGKKVFPENILFKNSNQVIAFCSVTGAAYTSRLKNFNDYVVNHPNEYCTLLRYETLQKVSGKVTIESIGALKNSANGEYRIFKLNDRIFFELLHSLVIDIANHDLDMEMGQALSQFLKLRSHWIFDKIIK